MSNQTQVNTTVKSEPEPGVFLTTYYTMSDDGHDTQYQVIERDPLDISLDIKQEITDGGTLDSTVKLENEEKIKEEDNNSDTAGPSPDNKRKGEVLNPERKMAPASKKTADEKRKGAAERKRRQRERIKNNSVLLEKERQKERERWEQRKKNGKTKTIVQLSRSEQKAQRANWRERNQRRKEKQNLTDNCNRYMNEKPPLDSPDEPSPDQTT